MYKQRSSMKRKGVYMNYEYYAKHDKQLITEVDYNNHQVAEKVCQPDAQRT
jgi:hypothetical protein